MTTAFTVGAAPIHLGYGFDGDLVSYRRSGWNHVHGIIPEIHKLGHQPGAIRVLVIPLWHLELGWRGGAFVEGLTPGPSRLRTVPTGFRLFWTAKARSFHAGGLYGPSRLEAVLEDDAAMARSLRSSPREGARSRDHTILWVPLMQFGGMQYVRAWHFAGEEIRRANATWPKTWVRIPFWTKS